VAGRKTEQNTSIFWSAILRAISFSCCKKAAHFQNHKSFFRAVAEGSSPGCEPRLNLEYGEPSPSPLHGPADGGRIWRQNFMAGVIIALASIKCVRSLSWVLCRSKTITRPRARDCFSLLREVRTGTQKTSSLGRKRAAIRMTTASSHR
jgi:hypothetical protein